MNTQNNAPESQEELKQEEAPKELNNGSDAPQDEEAKPEKKEEVIDYKAELEKAKADRDNYKEGMLNAKKKLKEQDKSTKTDDIDEKINNVVEEKLSKIQLDTRSDIVAEVTSQVSSNEDEQKLILHHYNNSLQKSGFSRTQILSDMRRAKLLANESGLHKENAELKASLKAKTSTSNSGQGSNISKPGVENYKLGSQEQLLFDRVNARRVSNKQKPLTVKEFLNK